MKRIKGFEWEDQPWFPGFLRRYMMDFLRFVLTTGNLYKPVTELLWQSLQQSGSRNVVDLCSGGGGAIPVLQKNLQKHSGTLIPFTLTDLYPDTELGKQTQHQPCNALFYYPHPVNAADVPRTLKGFRTMFSAFHHFDEDTAKKVLQNAVDAGEGIAIFDGSRSGPFLLLILLFQPVAFLLFTPFIKPFSVWRLVFTYLLPVVPLCTVWDGVMSALRLYQPEEMLLLSRSADASGAYTWNAGKVRNRVGISIAYLTGVPVVHKQTMESNPG